MISDKAMLICLHITMWTARKHDKRVSEEVAQSHEANTNAGRYNKHLLDQAEKLYLPTPGPNDKDKWVPREDPVPTTSRVMPTNVASHLLVLPVLGTPRQES